MLEPFGRDKKYGMVRCSLCYEVFRLKDDRQHKCVTVCPERRMADMGKWS